MEVDKGTLNEVANYVRKYFPPEAAKALVMFNSEYNDEGYDTSSKLILVFDKDGNELVPVKGKSVEARGKIPEMWDYIYNFNEWKDKNDEHETCIEDLVVELS